MQISGSNINTFTLLRFQFIPDTQPSYRFVKVSNGNWVSIDRGASEDIYLSKIYTYGTESEVNNIIQEIETNRSFESNYFTISNFNTIDDQIFGADIDYSGSINVTVLNFSKRKQKNFKVFTIELTLQMITKPYVYSGSPSLPTLKPEIGYTGTSLYTIKKSFSYDNSVTYLDQDNDTGILDINVKLNQVDMRAFRRYLLSTIRGGEMTISNLSGVSFPFGINRGGLPIKVKVLKFKDTLYNVNFWNVRLKMVESL